MSDRNRDLAHQDRPEHLNGGIIAGPKGLTAIVRSQVGPAERVRCLTIARTIRLRPRPSLSSSAIRRRCAHANRTSAGSPTRSCSLHSAGEEALIRARGRPLRCLRRWPDPTSSLARRRATPRRRSSAQSRDAVPPVGQRSTVRSPSIPMLSSAITSPVVAPKTVSRRSKPHGDLLAGLPLSPGPARRTKMRAGSRPKASLSTSSPEHDAAQDGPDAGQRRRDDHVG